MDNSDLNKLRGMCGLGHSTQNKKVSLSESEDLNSVLNNIEKYYKSMGINITREKMIEIAKIRLDSKDYCICCDTSKENCKCSEGSTCCDCNKNED
jgi:hypothetical protein